MALSTDLHAMQVSQCGGIMNVSNASYTYPSLSCHGAAKFVFAGNTHNISLSCSGNQIIARSTLIVVENNTESDGIYNCTLFGPSVKIGSKSSLYIMGQSVLNFTPEFTGTGSNIIVGHYLRINVFAPFGYNSTSDFGHRVAGFSYIFPLMNYTFNYSNTELQMQEFFGNNFTGRFSALKSKIPFGAYGINASQIFENVSNAKYGKIEGWKTFPLPQYMISRNGTVNYNPYEIDYSFLAFDQLVTFRLNITGNLNLTPMYIQPIYPTFNWNIVPDNGGRSITIKYLFAVPPQDLNWNFTAYLYRYDPTEFVVNPVAQGVGSHSALYRAFKFPDNSYSENSNGTLIFHINYTTPIAIGLNSSIMTAQGTILGLGSFVQDSTTPSFSFGLGYCAMPYNTSGYPINYITVSKSGEYTMTGELLPLAASALPQLVNEACSTGIVISGNDIVINCDNGTINDTGQGIIIENSSNISLNYCRIHGNGIEINNSTGISFYNLSITPSSEAASSGIAINDAQGVNFYNLSIGNGYTNPFSVFSSSGTPFSEAIEIYHLRMCGGENVTAIRHFAFIYSYSSSCQSGIGAFISDLNLTPFDELMLLTAALSATYAIIAFGQIRRKNGKKRHKA
ncbi:MAG: right-handed parallel beta-helix repeat-containing protein [Candidatus Micrarchaeaceae archaeon]